MKLNYKRTILVGLAFFSISALWQMYDSTVPLILRDTFHLGDTFAGFIMSIDNILALFMLPLFGMLSDRAGKRMPFVVFGTICAVFFIVLLPFAERAANLPFFFVALGLLLLSMSVYRSPAVALMPSVTEKPLRSKGNAVINLMGALGGVYSLLVIAVFGHGAGRTNYMPIFIAVGAFMLVSMLVLRLTVNEEKLVQNMRDCNYGVPPDSETEQEIAENRALPPAVMRSLLLILFSVALWYMGYNAITTAFSKYATSVWGHNLAQASTCMLVATIGAVVSYIPIGALASKIGRKKTILIGAATLASCFAVGAIAATKFSAALYVLFALIGFAWACINVNSYPMVVEISQHGNIGKYTGYYYAFSMAAQIATPILSGWLLEHVGYHTLFPYAALMVAFSFVTMSLTRHGDNKPVPRGSRLEAFDLDD